MYFYFYFLNEHWIRLIFCMLTIVREPLDSFVSKLHFWLWARLQLLLVWQQKTLSFRGNRAKKCSKTQPFVDVWIRAPILFLFFIESFPWAFDSVVSKSSHFASSPQALSLLFSLFLLIQTIRLLVKLTFFLPICSTLALFFIHYPFQGIGTWSL